MYVTAAQLLVMPGALELAQLATPEDRPIITAELMTLTITGGDRSGYPLDEQADADAALDRIEAEITRTAELIDGYLGTRYSLPLSPVPGILQTWATDIVRFRLAKDLHTDGDSKSVIERRYRDALKFLGEVRDGRFSLGAIDPIETAPGLDVRFETPDKVFGRTQLGRFR